MNPDARRRTCWRAHASPENQRGGHHFARQWVCPCHWWHEPCVRVPASGALPYGELEDGARVECSTVGARINALIAKGQFAEAEALIAEATAGGLISQPQAAEKLQKIVQLSTRVGNRCCRTRTSASRRRPS